VSLFWSQWQSQFFNASVVRWLRDDWHASVIRVPLAVHEGGYLEHPERERHKIEKVIEAAIEHGLYVIVDWHSHEAEIAAAERFFSSIARTYGTYPNLIYELWNEPAAQFTWRRHIKPYHERVTAVIRRFDPHGVMIAGTERWSQHVDVAARDPLQLVNVAYSLHFYANSHGQELRDRVTSALSDGAAIIVSEWGTCEAGGDGPIDPRKLHTWLDFVEQHRLSSVNWSIADKDESSAALRTGAAASGGWSLDTLSTSGRIVREYLRRPEAYRADASNVAGR
jgi:endoglucanase